MCTTVVIPSFLLKRDVHNVDSSLLLLKRDVHNGVYPSSCSGPRDMHKGEIVVDHAGQTARC